MELVPVMDFITRVSHRGCPDNRQIRFTMEERFDFITEEGLDQFVAAGLTMF